MYELMTQQEREIIIGGSDLIGPKDYMNRVKVCYWFQLVLLVIVTNAGVGPKYGAAGIVEQKPDHSAVQSAFCGGWSWPLAFLYVSREVGTNL
jgi:hypothetical protein